MLPLPGAAPAIASVIRRRALAVLLSSSALLAGACSTDGPASPPADGSVAGAVTLIGSDGSANPAALDVALYASLEDLESWTATYRSPLHRIPGAARVYEFAFPRVAAGAYYVRACFEFGCGEYRERGTATLLRVLVLEGRVTHLPFGI